MNIKRVINGIQHMVKQGTIIIFSLLFEQKLIQDDDKS